jgi:hypothetical protein
LEEEEDMVRASKVKNFQSIENARSWWCLLPNTVWFIRNLLLPSLWTAEISAVHTRLSWEAFLIFWDLQIKSQPYIQDFLEKLSSFFGIHKSNPNRTYKIFLGSFHHLLGSIYRRSDLNRRYKTFLRRFHHLWDRFTNQISTIQVWLPLEFFHQPWSSLLKSLSCISQKYWNHFHVFHRRVSSQNHCWNHFHVFHKNIVEITFMYFTKKINVEITFMYFTKPLLKSLSCISQCQSEITFMCFRKQMLKSLSCISQNHCWNHFHVFHNANLKSLSCVSENKCWNHFHVFHKTIVEITFMYFTMPIWNHFHVFQKTNVEITFMYFTKPLLKSLSCISQNHCWNHFHVFHKKKKNTMLISLSCISQH